MAQQLIFDLPARAALGRDDFYVSPANAVALATVENWQEWPGGKLVLVGAKGSGKTHLAHVFAAQSGGQVLGAADISGADLPALSARPLALDGAECISDETALFHLHNLMAEARQPLLMTGDTPPSRWPLKLPDLISRLTAAPVARLDPPDDTLLAAILAKQFSDRQLSPPANLIPYLVSRMERSASAARDLVARLDAVALGEKRPLNRALAARLLDNSGQDGP